MPLMDLFWTMLIFFCWVMWFMLLFRVYSDLFSRDDIGGWGKAGWAVLTLLLPVLGVFAYLISQGREIVDRSAREADRRRAPTATSIHPAAPAAGADQSAVARDLVRSGAITPEESQRLTRADDR
jgi:Phospholipase_D-nuclease N-terminal